MRNVAETAADVAWGVLCAFFVTLVLCALLGCNDASACGQEPYPPHEEDPMQLWLSYELNNGWELWMERPKYSSRLGCFNISDDDEDSTLEPYMVADGHTVARMLGLYPSGGETPQLFKVKVTEIKKIKPAE